jgi:hypothetical protein
MIRKENVQRMGRKRRSYMVLVSKPRSRLEDNIKIDIKRE